MKLFLNRMGAGGLTWGGLVCCALLWLGAPACRGEEATNSVATNTAAKFESKPEEATNQVVVTPTNTVGAGMALSVPTNGAAVVKRSAEVPAGASELGELPVPSSMKVVRETPAEDTLKWIQGQLEMAREQRRGKNYDAARQILANVMASNAPTELKRTTLFELALVAQDEGKPVKAQQIFSQYAQLYPTDPSLPEILLRQGLLYRQMGVNSLAISKFYTVMASALKLKLDNIEYYQKLVLQAQVEIADTYYMEGNYDDSADFYGRLLKSGSPELDREQVHFKLVRSLSFRTNSTDVIAKGQSFLEVYPESADVPEVRFLLASTLKKIGRNQDAMRQVLLLLQNEQGKADKNPAAWTYWQQRAGNEIASQLFKEGDYMGALEIYLNLASLDKSPEWQLPVWYQTGLVYEQLMQPQKAVELYGKILGRKKDLSARAMTPSMESLLEMTRWRKDYLEWVEKAKTTNLSFHANLINMTNATGATASQTAESPAAEPPPPATPR